MTGGATTASFGNCERARRRAGRHAVAGGKEHEVKPGLFKLAETGGRGPVKLGGVVALARRDRSAAVDPPGADLAGWKRIDRANLPAEKRPVWKVTEGRLSRWVGRGRWSIRRSTAISRSRCSAIAKPVRQWRPVHPRDPGRLHERLRGARRHSRCHEGDPGRPFTYATGGIDDRQDARRLVSRDFEWFTMTAVADGPHLATWVNGVQVTD
jgi:hypothetical protein